MDSTRGDLDAPRMIDMTTEQLLPLSKVPGYLEKRGLGRRVSIQAVHRWAHHGAGGVVLESIRIGGTTVTSIEAMQRWIAARSHAKEAARSPVVSPPPTSQHLPPARRPIVESAATMKTLMDHRLLPTPLDATLGKLGMEGNVGYVSDVLHRAGLRSEADVARMSKAQLLAIPRLGPFGRSLVTLLKDRVDAEKSASPS